MGMLKGDIGEPVKLSEVRLLKALNAILVGFSFFFPEGSGELATLLYETPAFHVFSYR